MKYNCKKRICIDCKKSYFGCTTSKRCRECWRIKEKKSKKIRKNFNRKYFLEKLSNECLFCLKIKNIEIHHIDKNPSNNNIKNLVCICVRCHRRLHSKIYANL